MEYISAFFLTYFTLRRYHRSISGKYFSGDKESLRFDCAFKLQK